MDNEVPSVLTFGEDISNAKPPAPIPTGTYRWSVKHAEAGMSKASGKRMITLQLHCTPDQYPADYVDGNPDGTLLSYYIGAEDTPMGRWMMKRACEVFGVPMSRDINVLEFQGREVMGKVTHEMYEGNPQARIERGGLSLV